MTPTYCAECDRITPCPHSTPAREDARTDGGQSIEIVSTDPLAHLSPAQRDAFVAVDVHGQGVREYARTWKKSAGTIGNLLGRARETIQAAVCAHCETPVALTASACESCGEHPFIVQESLGRDSPDVVPDAAEPTQGAIHV